MTSSAPEAAATDSPAFLKAVTQLGQRRPVVTSRAIYNRQGVKLLEGGVQIDATLYDRLVAHRLAAPLDESVDSAPSVAGTTLREASEAVLARQPFFGLMAPAAGRVRDMLLQAIEAVPLPRPVALHLTLARETRPALFEHSIQMAILCAHLVREGGAPIHDITTAAAAGLLHDLGMLHIDAGLLDTGHRLSGDERRPLYVHPITSSMLIARFHEYPSEVSRAIVEHHERLDGSGYPRSLAGDAISPLGRLVALCEVVTAMFDGARDYPEQRVSLLLRMSPRRYEPSLVPSIHRLLRAVPPVPGAALRPVADSLRHLQAQAALLNDWHRQVRAIAPTLPAPARELLGAVAEQADTLQRMLFEAGITPEQLGMLGRDAADDPAVAVDL
jgi:HD-GYP domain-containing protein (c-di-GMP phosphodiesterase class II)